MSSPALCPRTWLQSGLQRVLNIPFSSLLGSRSGMGHQASNLSLSLASRGRILAELLLPGLGRAAVFLSGCIWEVGSPSPGAGLRVLRAEGRQAGWRSLASWAVSFLPGLRPAPASDVRARRAGSPQGRQPSAPPPPLPRPVASPSYSGLQGSSRSSREGPGSRSWPAVCPPVG